LIEADDCPSTGSAIITTITSQSSSNLALVAAGRRTGWPARDGRLTAVNLCLL
jgi:hypothetical protein